MRGAGVRSCRFRAEVSAGIDELAREPLAGSRRRAGTVPLPVASELAAGARPRYRFWTAITLGVPLLTHDRDFCRIPDDLLLLVTDRADRFCQCRKLLTEKAGWWPPAS
ncbi:MAG: hypothetical protein QOE87_195 [Gaiellales bacterium]|jgi:hypothetical protein|nr:hypothetical protein [Gaiellales bacterium]